MPKKQRKVMLMTPRDHTLAIARKTLRMPCEMIGVMGGGYTSHVQAVEVIKDLTGKEPVISCRCSKEEA
jgi:hypothetical protein